MAQEGSKNEKKAFVSRAPHEFPRSRHASTLDVIRTRTLVHPASRTSAYIPTVDAIRPTPGRRSPAYISIDLALSASFRVQRSYSSHRVQCSVVA
ncbi:hypothetical protein GWI33_015300 [Rhynchophorus ferrugineus]|uniref:Uncharacterized protein n=1 Tax=Rhynchophorus ferrugineus TaxID=354439 RepID=A0A834I3L2_RHYFE|nr:hypothetical protein GWI33_015300 [Rhynchophorus ferrugineus]